MVPTDEIKSQSSINTMKSVINSIQTLSSEKIQMKFLPSQYWLLSILRGISLDCSEFGISMLLMRILRIDSKDYTVQFFNSQYIVYALKKLKMRMLMADPIEKSCIFSTACYL